MDDITKVDLIFLGILYMFQVLTLWFYDYITLYFGHDIAEFLTGVSQWPGIADLLTNYGTTNTLIIGLFCLISGIGLIREKSWAWGSAMVVLAFIIAQTGVSFIASVISSDWFNASTFINLSILLVAILGIVLEKPWKKEKKVIKKILVASISYEKIKCDKLADQLKINKKELVDLIIDLIYKNTISGTINLPYIYFDCNTNKLKLHSQHLKPKNRMYIIKEDNDNDLKTMVGIKNKIIIHEKTPETQTSVKNKPKTDTKKSTTKTGIKSRPKTDTKKSTTKTGIKSRLKTDTKKSTTKATKATGKSKSKTNAKKPTTKATGKNKSKTNAKKPTTKATGKNKSKT
ncbi:MAG: PCI domain-containing protein [Candidatus Helarchaeota archaeon]